MTYHVSGELFYRLSEDYFSPDNKGRIDSYYPRTIKLDFETVSGHVDAAVTVTTKLGRSITYIFKVGLFPLLVIRQG